MTDRIGLTALTAAPLIHIGYHKTGTTWLQHNFLAHQPKARLAPREDIVRAFLAPNAFVFDAQRARRILAGRTDQRLLVSMEALSGYPHNGGLHGCLARDMIERLHQTFPEASILVTLRSQPDVIAASYAQYVRLGGTASPRRYVGQIDRPGRPDKTPRFNLDHFNYLHLLRAYRRRFGADRLHVMLYEYFRDDMRACLDALARQLDLAVPEIALTASRRNASYRPGLLRLARVLGRFTSRDVIGKHHWIHIPGWYALHRGTLEALNFVAPNPRGSEPRRVLGPRLVNFIKSEYAESNRRIADEFGLPLAEYGYPGW